MITLLDTFVYHDEEETQINQIDQIIDNPTALTPIHISTPPATPTWQGLVPTEQLINVHNVQTHLPPIPTTRHAVELLLHTAPPLPPKNTSQQPLPVYLGPTNIRNRLLYIDTFITPSFADHHIHFTDGTFDSKSFTTSDTTFIGAPDPAICCNYQLVRIYFFLLNDKNKFQICFIHQIDQTSMYYAQSLDLLDYVLFHATECIDFDRQVLMMVEKQQDSAQQEHQEQQQLKSHDHSIIIIPTYGYGGDDGDDDAQYQEYPSVENPLSSPLTFDEFEMPPQSEIPTPHHIQPLIDIGLGAHRFRPSGHRIDQVHLQAFFCHATIHTPHPNTNNLTLTNGHTWCCVPEHSAVYRNYTHTQCSGPILGFGGDVVLHFSPQHDDVLQLPTPRAALTFIRPALLTALPHIQPHLRCPTTFPNTLPLHLLKSYQIGVVPQLVVDEYGDEDEDDEDIANNFPPDHHNPNLLLGGTPGDIIYDYELYREEAMLHHNNYIQSTQIAAHCNDLTTHMPYKHPDEHRFHQDYLDPQYPTGGYQSERTQTTHHFVQGLQDVEHSFYFSRFAPPLPPAPDHTTAFFQHNPDVTPLTFAVAQYHLHPTPNGRCYFLGDRHPILPAQTLLYTTCVAHYARGKTLTPTLELHDGTGRYRVASQDHCNKVSTCLHFQPTIGLFFVCRIYFKLLPPDQFAFSTTRAQGAAHCHTLTGNIQPIAYQPFYPRALSNPAATRAEMFVQPLTHHHWLDSIMYYYEHCMIHNPLLKPLGEQCRRHQCHHHHLDHHHPQQQEEEEEEEWEHPEQAHYSFQITSNVSHVLPRPLSPPALPDTPFHAIFMDSDTPLTPMNHHNDIDIVFISPDAAADLSTATSHASPFSSAFDQQQSPVIPHNAPTPTYRLVANKQGVCPEPGSFYFRITQYSPSAPPPTSGINTIPRLAHESVLIARAVNRLPAPADPDVVDDEHHTMYNTTAKQLQQALLDHQLERVLYALTCLVRYHNVGLTSAMTHINMLNDTTRFNEVNPICEEEEGVGDDE